MANAQTRSTIDDNTDPTARRIVSLLRGPYMKALTDMETRMRARYPDLRPSHFIVFQLIEYPPNGSRLTELAAAARMTKPSMLELVDGLESRGYVERVPDPTDRRAKLIRLTDHGLAAFEHGFQAVNEMQQEWSDQIGETKFLELFQLLEELNQVLDVPHYGRRQAPSLVEAGGAA